jgi:Na+/melibiose symporter-like transporter
MIVDSLELIEGRLHFFTLIGLTVYVVITVANYSTPSIDVVYQVISGGFGNQTIIVLESGGFV